MEITLTNRTADRAIVATCSVQSAFTILTALCGFYSGDNVIVTVRNERDEITSLCAEFEADTKECHEWLREFVA